MCVCVCVVAASVAAARPPGCCLPARPPPNHRVYFSIRRHMWVVDINGGRELLRFSAIGGGEREELPWLLFVRVPPSVINANRFDAETLIIHKLSLRKFTTRTICVSNIKMNVQ